MLSRLSMTLTLMTTAMAISVGHAGFRQAARVFAAQPAAAPGPASGQHAFDSLAGRWRVHSRRLEHPLAGSKDWVEFDGTSLSRKILDGRANVDEFEADGAAGHILSMTVRTYNPTTGEWSIYRANSKTGSMSMPPFVGRFIDGRGEFYDHEVVNGRMVYVRLLWLPETRDQMRWEQAFSVDEGKTWETNWTMDSTRTEGAPI